jgi:hypothetical protein
MSDIESVLNDLTRGLPREDQAAIVEAVRNRTLERTGQMSGMVELHFVDRAGNSHWLAVTEHDADVLLAPSAIRAEIERD